MSGNLDKNSGDASVNVGYNMNIDVYKRQV